MLPELERLLEYKRIEFEAERLKFYYCLYLHDMMLEGECILIKKNFELIINGEVKHSGTILLRKGELDAGKIRTLYGTYTLKDGRWLWDFTGERELKFL